MTREYKHWQCVSSYVLTYNIVVTNVQCGPLLGFLSVLPVPTRAVKFLRDVFAKI